MGVCEHHKLRAVAVDSWKFQIAVFINSVGVCFSEHHVILV